ncbi:LytR/AlgR family response regulator transcription factor [Chryseosolibacter indicus]|uniref:LytTR family DNA-binding domain-containing protein n=1 Tax=Chryseosolibacter indicus TaxID=2782351 RepID=A0ABS5VMD2_9BACT|nr:LytTR family DNA-binding domain-containing protein [Chryseosolibacter indicus]MBT1702610.1 LytTR family DNA-binding domain-containing protein [Chryseosolibacter indicus]
MIRCLIVDDEPLARNLLSDYVKKVPYLQLIDACPNPLTALEVIRNNNVDLLLLDIQMPEITGLTLLKTLQKKPFVILTTAYSEYALEGYELDVIDYLLKPITFERFLKAVEKMNQRIQLPEASEETTAIKEPAQPFVFVKDGTKLVKVQWEDILYVEGLKDYVTIHTKIQKVVTLQRLKSLETQLPVNQFVRVHHSYIVALKAIDAVHRNEIQIGSTFIPISDSYKKTFREIVEKNQMQ